MEWEYKTIRFEKKEFMTSALNIDALDQKLNVFGSQGWELVGFETRTGMIGNELAAVAIFKRPRES